MLTVETNTFRVLGGIGALVGMLFARDFIATFLFWAVYILGGLHVGSYAWRHRELWLNRKNPENVKGLGFPVPKDKSSREAPWVLVTGGAHGLGRHLATEYLLMGYNVVVWDINGHELRKCEDAVKDMPAGRVRGTLICTQCDISKEDDVKQRVMELQTTIKGKSTGRLLPSIDILVLNAGIVNGTNVVNSDANAIRRLFGVNVFQMFNVSRELVPEMIKDSDAQKNSEILGASTHIGGPKHIVVVGSVAGYAGAAQLADYTASKGASNLFAESFAAELRYKHPAFSVSLICPYIIDTGMFDGCRPFRFFPVLKTADVAAEIIDAVRYRKQLVVMPWILHGLLLAKGALPFWVIPYVDQVLGASKAMRDFSPRVRQGDRLRTD